MKLPSCIPSLKNQKAKTKNKKAPSQLIFSGKRLAFVSMLLLLNLFLLFLSSCASSKKFVGENKEEEKDTRKEVRFGKEVIPVSTIPVRVLVEENLADFDFAVETPLKISNDEKEIAVVRNGNQIKITNESGKLTLRINGNNFSSISFRFSSADSNDIFSFNGKKYRGQLLVSPNSLVNIIPLEDYLKGVIPAEMPLGKNDENFEALKAFAICARTYTMMKLNEKKTGFDLYVDVRDQVYGGTEKEKELSNKAVDATTGMILEYNGEPAGIFYSASCGGYSEDGANVFVNGNRPYLKVVKDGDEPYCIITPRFEWEEKYYVQEFLNRLIKAGFVNSSDFKIEAIKINSRFNSGRVNEMEIDLNSGTGENEIVKIYGNQIRSIIRTADDKGILRSTMFEVSLESDTVSIKGKGYGHGVGLCQWGAIAQSRLGKAYNEILLHYFPGTIVRQLKKNN